MERGADRGACVLAEDRRRVRRREATYDRKLLPGAASAVCLAPVVVPRASPDVGVVARRLLAPRVGIAGREEERDAEDAPGDLHWSASSIVKAPASLLEKPSTTRR